MVGFGALVEEQPTEEHMTHTDGMGLVDGLKSCWSPSILVISSRTCFCILFQTSDVLMHFERGGSTSWPSDLSRYSVFHRSTWVPTHPPKLAWRRCRLVRWFDAMRSTNKGPMKCPIANSRRFHEPLYRGKCNRKWMRLLMTPSDFCEDRTHLEKGIFRNESSTAYEESNEWRPFDFEGEQFDFISFSEIPRSGKCQSRRDNFRKKESRIISIDNFLCGS
jgi:hypothetical protein